MVEIHMHVRLQRDYDIGDTIQCLRYYAGWADKIVGQVLLVSMTEVYGLLLSFVSLL